MCIRQHLTIVRCCGKLFFAYRLYVPRQEDHILEFARALAAVIRRRREKLGLSLTQLGIQSGLSQQSVSYLERLKRLPNIETLIKVSGALKMKVSALLAQAEKEVGKKAK